MSRPTDRAIEESKGVTKLSEADRHRLLASERRRLTLDVLADQTTTMDLRELSAEVAAREVDIVDEDTVETVAISLHHVHLPRMAKLGALSYDSESHRIEPHRILVTI